MRILITLILLTLCGFLQAQSGIRGIVLDERSQPLEGATIVLGAKNALSDAQGAFLIQVDNGDYELKISYVGKRLMERTVRVNGVVQETFVMISEGQILDEVLVRAIRAQDNTPMTFSTITEEDLESRNLGQDLPILLNHLPSVVTTSDAGAGIGYTGIRVRGSDASRVNVTINGIPYNDSESQGTFWVNMGDFGSSVQNVQLQRGVGTSTNGAGAFGASLNLLTSGTQSEASGRIDNSIGSFGTRKHSIEYNTGRLGKHVTLSGRLSRINSDGYVDRASSDLRGYFLQADYVNKNTVVKALTFGGKQETYLAWNGIDEDKLKTDRTFNPSGMYTDENGVTRFYDNEVDHYDQDHYQLHINRKLNENISFNIAGHYTFGRGYYEQFKEDADVVDYALQPAVIGNDTIHTSDLVRRKWLDNDFYGFTASLDIKQGEHEHILGGAWNQYEGDHFGEVIWARYAPDADIRHQYYNNVGEKDEWNAYLKSTWALGGNWEAFTDLQLRMIEYRADGISDQPVNESFEFFNPKAGLTYRENDDVFYASFARASREPNRDDYENGRPDPEVLNDIELGWRASREKFKFNANLFAMLYEEQLVLTGELDDVGSPIRENSGESRRLGLELDASYHLNEKLSFHPNVTISQNKNIDYHITNADGELESLGDTEISFSPNLIMGNIIRWSPVKGFEASLLTKYVGEQYMGNHDDKTSLLDAYLVNDLNFAYTIQPKSTFKEIAISLLVNNVLDEEYVSNGYWGPGYAGYYPQAGINFLTGLSLRF